jgi:hypothetical protein
LGRGMVHAVVRVHRQPQARARRTRDRPGGPTLR